MKSSIFLVFLLLIGIILGGCKAPDDATKGTKDSTSNLEKKAGGADE